jgi:hypothetical protein
MEATAKTAAETYTVSPAGMAARGARPWLHRLGRDVIVSWSFGILVYIMRARAVASHTRAGWMGEAACHE